MRNCRLCSSKQLNKFLDLGHTPPADQFLRAEQLTQPVVYYPLDVYMCADCHFVQLGHVVSPEVLYKYDYPYESSTTQAGTTHYHRFAESVAIAYGFGKGDLAVDIGSNVGVLLDGFRKMGLTIQGVDPATNIAAIAEKRGVETISAFFSMPVAEEIVHRKGKAAVITGTNVFAHIDDLDDLLLSVRHLLKPEGVFIIEAPHLLHLIENLEYDTIYHEHLSYISIKPLVPFFKKFGMEITRVEQKDIHGGSIRIFVTNQGAHPVNDSVAAIIRTEDEHELGNLSKLKIFAERVAQNRKDLQWLLQDLKHQGKRIAGVSAPAKGMTLLNYCRIGPELLDYVTEKSKLKINRYTPGTHIPIFGDEQLLIDQPDYVLLLAWNFAEEIMNNLSEYKKRGGKFIIPIPKPIIL
jgi:hypothetical protein